jgi:3-hydroxyacyl-[acyl-carrier-protein] dehydratase
VRFVLVDKIVEFELGTRARGYRDLPADAEHYRDHLPNYPVEPGSLVLETMAQLGGRLVQQSVRLASGREVLPMVAMVGSAEFRRPVRPPCRLDLAADVLSIRGASARVSVSAQVDGHPVASATVTYGLISLDHDAVGIGAENAAAIREWGRRTWAAMTGGAFDGAEVPGGDAVREE